MAGVPVAARLEEDQARAFRELTNEIGTTPGDAIRVFVAAFNAVGGFPFDVRRQPKAEPFSSEQEATQFATRLGRADYLLRFWAGGLMV
jgi:DNA-damage-inducible protein J